MRIIARRSSDLDLGRHRYAHPAPKPEETVRAGLPALVPGAERSNTLATAKNRPVTALIAQLVAGAEDLPASRARRRAEPSIGADAYRMVAGLGPALPRATSRLI
jgi:hypothetical protein